MQFSRLMVLASAMAALAAGPAAAQFASPQVALAGAAGGMTCAEFTHMSPHHRDAVVRQLNASAPPQTLAPGLPTETTIGRGHRRRVVVQQQTPETPLTSGILVAACQAQPAFTTLREAYTSGRSGLLVRHRR